jgi:hypothetical protein
MRKPATPSDRAPKPEEIPMGTTVYIGQRKIKGRKPVSIEQPAPRERKQEKQSE